MWAGVALIAWDTLLLYLIFILHVSSDQVWDQDKASNHQDQEEASKDSTSFRTILYYGAWPADTVPAGEKKFTDANCPVYRCMMTMESKLADKVDAIIFRRDYRPEHFAYNRHPRQVWIYYVNESPLTWPSWKQLADHNILFNMTATYRLDSTIPIVSLTTIPKRLIHPLAADVTNIASTKTKNIAWLVSDCHAHNERLKYVHELQKHIGVDIYGKCGNLTCQNPDCTKHSLISQYKFYLAFENSNCRDYITEKLWLNAFKFSGVPVVMGPRKSTYERLTPPGSFIHVDDFHSPEHLAQHLQNLLDDDHLYNQYFKWKEQYELVASENWLCRLCELLHTHEGHVGWYPDFRRWWGAEDICVQPTPENPYASWKIQTMMKKM